MISTTPRRRSELWQRLRSARNFAEKTQGDVAKEMGLTRPAVSLWESRNASNRSNPTGEQLMQLAKYLNVPAGFLMDDTVDAEAVSEYVDLSASNFSDTRELAVAVDQGERVARAFWSSVEYTVMMTRPGLGSSFHLPIANAAVQIEAPFLHGSNLVGFASEGAEDNGRLLLSGASALLLLERAMGRKTVKHLLIWTRTGRFEVSGRAMFEKTFDVRIHSFNDVTRAAAYLIEL